MADLMSWGITLAHGKSVWKAEGMPSRFFDRLGALDRALESVALPEGAEEKLIQGPLADALTRVGQLAMRPGWPALPWSGLGRRSTFPGGEDGIVFV